MRIVAGTGVFLVSGPGGKTLENIDKEAQKLYNFLDE